MCFSNTLRTCLSLVEATSASVVPAFLEFRDLFRGAGDTFRGQQRVSARFFEFLKLARKEIKAQRVCKPASLLKPSTSVC